MAPTLSKMATNDQHGENSPYFDGWKSYDKDPFHPTRNPHGVIQMGLAENQLSFDLVEEWIKKNPKASICTSEGIKLFRDTANFQDYHGLPEFRKGVARFMGKARGNRVSFDPERIVMAGGATGANETVMFCLADPGDAFLVPSPYYPAFLRDLRWRTGVQLIPITCKTSDNFQISIEALQQAYENAKGENVNVKGLILTNPSNPLGTTLDRETLRSIVSFTNSHNLHFVSDEIYAGTVFATPGFVSVAEILEAEKHLNRDLIHIVYSLSKDMGFPGFRVGIIYSYNDAVVSCARKMSSFGLVSSQTQHLLALMLSDDDFVDRFLAESSERLGKRHKLFTGGLEQLNIKCLKSNAGLFCWMDLRPLLKEPTFDAEMSLWRLIINDVKLNVSPGSSFECHEPGWFRVCFANMDDETVEIALSRIRRFVGKENPKTKQNDDGNDKAQKETKQRSWQKNLQLSFSKRKTMYDENIMVALSPHSPIPRSSLVLARN
nr:1-aminocyclopropane-1-carboxylate synthase-like [Ipomoea trifida]